jgi:hypothetical protein
MSEQRFALREEHRRDRPAPGTIAGPFLKVTGRAWALANSHKPSWMNPKFDYGRSQGDEPAPPPLPTLAVTCPSCGHHFHA